jgi:hypothetical protein
MHIQSAGCVEENGCCDVLSGASLSSYAFHVSVSLMLHFDMYRGLSV